MRLPGKAAAEVSRATAWAMPKPEAWSQQAPDRAQKLGMIRIFAASFGRETAAKRLW